jgi:BMFP domain-containing protein YqiC
MNAKLDALMERIDMLEAKLAEYEGEEESTDDEEEED